MSKRNDRFEKVPKDLHHSHKHGHRYANLGKPTPEYQCWSGILKRVKNPNDKLFPYYGGRGIDMDPRWENFECFLKDVGMKPFGELSLDRIDNEKGYYAYNVRWATRTEQSRNRRNNIIVDWVGEDTCLSEACELLGWRYKVVWSWVNQGKDFNWIENRAKELWDGEKVKLR